MMGMFGRFLEVSVPTSEILRSLAFYRSLGFAELVTGDIRAWHYAVVTDGNIAIGLHGAGIPEPALSFVRPNLARQVQAMEEAGHEFEFRRLGAEQFHEAGLRSPDGLLILMMEARTFSPGQFDDGPEAVIGRCCEVTVGCADPAASRSFFASAGFLAAGEPQAEVPVMETPGIRLGLRTGASAPALRFAVPDLSAVIRRLGDNDLHPRRSPDGYVLKAPEGTLLVLGD